MRRTHSPPLLSCAAQSGTLATGLPRAASDAKPRLQGAARVPGTDLGRRAVPHTARQAGRRPRTGRVGCGGMRDVPTRPVIGAARHPGACLRLFVRLPGVRGKMARRRGQRRRRGVATGAFRAVETARGQENSRFSGRLIMTTWKKFLWTIGPCLLLIPACSVATAPQSLGSGSAPSTTPAGTDESPYFPGLFNSAQTAGGPGFAAFRCEFKVPSIPVLEFPEDARFLWCGVQQDGVPEGQEFGVLQPVLMFGADCIQRLPEGQRFGPGNDPTYESRPYWYVSAQYVYPDSSPTHFKCTTGPVFKVNPGETLSSVITYDPTSDTMTVWVSARSGHSTLVVKHPKDDPSLFWRQFVGGDHLFFNAVLEVPQPIPRDALPPEVLQGWPITARVEALPGLPQILPEAWQLLGDTCNTLDVDCVHDSAHLESVCTWSTRN